MKIAAKVFLVGQFLDIAGNCIWLGNSWRHLQNHIWLGNSWKHLQNHFWLGNNLFKHLNYWSGMTTCTAEPTGVRLGEPDLLSLLLLLALLLMRAMPPLAPVELLADTGFLK